MRIYTLQIHTTEDEAKTDDLYHYSDFDNLCAEFKRRVEILKGGSNLMEESYPEMNENGEVRGGFKFANADGTFVIGEAYDYDILDED